MRRRDPKRGVPLGGTGFESLLVWFMAMELAEIAAKG
jgi:hypothetical protein